MNTIDESHSSIFSPFIDMPNRFYTVFVLTAWLASMSWLFMAKIWPTLHGGDPPDYSTSVANVPANYQPTVWRISWKDRRIGMATNQTLPRANGIALRYVVQFEQLPLEMMLSEAFGIFGSMLFRESTDGKGANDSQQSWALDLLLATELQFNNQRQFTGFHTNGDLGNLQGFLQMNGVVDEQHKLVLTTQFKTFGQAAKELRHEIELPMNAVVGDAFGPRTELKNLHVGQKWTIPIYRPFPPNSPVQIVAAQAERHELILWNGRDVETILVVYRSDAGTGLQSTRDPIAREWVRDDGLVLQQEVVWSGATIRFERIPDAPHEPITEFLNADEHPRLWSK